MFTMIFCTAYWTFLIFLSVNIIFVCTWEFFPFCYSATDLIFFLFRNVVYISSVVLSQFIVALAQSCLSLYHFSVGEDLYQLSCSASSCLRLASLLHICALLQVFHFISKVN